MTRRWSLAAAFLLTVVCGFLIVSFGSSSGVFAWGGHGGGTGAVQTQSTSPDVGTTVSDVSMPVDSGSSDTPDRGDDDGEHRDDDEHEESEHEEGERD